MSDTIQVTRVKMQAIDEDGYPAGLPWFTVLARDNRETVLGLEYRSQEDLEAAIGNAASLVDVADPEYIRFEGLDRDEIGRQNYDGPFVRAED